MNGEHGDALPACVSSGKPPRVAVRRHVKKRNLMIRLVRTALTLLSLMCASTTYAATSDENVVRQIQALAWQKGPASTMLANRAQILILSSEGFLPEADASKFLTLTGNLPSAHTAILASNRWWSTLDLGQSGYFKDDDKIEPDALLQQLKDSDAPANAERRKQGLDELFNEGWYIPPRYDPVAKHLK